MLSEVMFGEVMFGEVMFCEVMLTSKQECLPARACSGDPQRTVAEKGDKDHSCAAAKSTMSNILTGL